MQAASESSPAAPVAAPPPEAAPAAAAPAPAAEAIDLSFVPEAFVKDGKPDLEAFKAHYADLSKAPEIPEAYEYAIPADLKFDGLPEGMIIAIDAKDPVMAPLFEDLTGILKGMKAPAESAQQITGLLAKYEAAKFTQALAVQQAEMDTLGPQATARIEAVTRTMETLLSADQVKALQGATKSAHALQALEKLLGPRGLTPPTPIPQQNEPDPLAARYPKSAAR